MELPEQIRFIPGVQPIVNAKVCAVYFLVKGGRVVYVGQSINVIQRMSGHGDKAFDTAFYISVPVDDLQKVEARYIREFKPILNGSNKWSPRKTKPKVESSMFDICGRYISPRFRVPAPLIKENRVLAARRQETRIITEENV